MTVVVGILNKRGASIAADSATTYTVANTLPNGKISSEETKIVNSGNKMLRLSDVMPISIMIVDTASILNTPWDVIIRWYRKKRGNEIFDTVEDIVKDFLDFIPKQEFFLINSLIANWRHHTELVFTGYGNNQKYPQLVHVVIKGVVDHKLQYNTDDFEIFTISDEHPSEILYFGQTDITSALTEDISKNEDNKLLCTKILSIFMVKKQIMMADNLIDEDKLDLPLCESKIMSVLNARHEGLRQKWYNAVKDYSLQEMANLAKTLINATELHRSIMFQKESVGGLIDLAVITREDGFQWLNRKSWYEPSKGGQYGKFGI